MDPTLIISPEITLTAFRPEDKDLLAQYLNDPVIYQNTSNIPKNYSEQDAEEWLLKVAKRREELGIETSWVIRHRVHGLMGSIGRVAQTGVDGHSDEIGYWLGTPFRGKGIMSAVALVFSNWLFETSPLIRLEARAFPHNPASIRVLEKAGFEKEGYARKKTIKDGEYLDSVLMARLK